MSVPAEEEFIRLLKCGTARTVRDWINSNLNMDLHYPLSDLTTPFTAAIDRSDPALFQLLIDKVPADLESTLTRPCGETVLMYAAAHSANTEILHALVRKGADLYARDMHGWNCLFHAVIGKRPENVSALLQADYEIPLEPRDREGRTPLVIAIYLSSLEVFDLLISSGADVNATDDVGLSALQVAILRRRRDCAIRLMRSGARSDAVTPFSGITTYTLMEELMGDILPVHRNVFDEMRNYCKREVVCKIKMC